MKKQDPDWEFTSKDPRDERAKEMAKQALCLAMENKFGFTYLNNVHGLSFYFPDKGMVSCHMTYLEWENREELFTKMMAEAKEMI